MSGSWGVGMAAFDDLFSVWPFAVVLLAFCAGYIVGGIVQRG